MAARRRKVGVVLAALLAWSVASCGLLPTEQPVFPDLPVPTSEPIDRDCRTPVPLATIDIQGCHDALGRSLGPYVEGNPPKVVARFYEPERHCFVVRVLSPEFRISLAEKHSIQRRVQEATGLPTVVEIVDRVDGPGRLKQV